MADVKKHILLTGMPGVGKTTLIKKICTELAKRNVKTTGFYTEELRESGQRIGFDVITVGGHRDKLARNINHVTSAEMTKFKVGQYIVFPTVFERSVLHLFEEKTEILIIDEIGKIELFSKKFEAAVKKAFSNSTTIILGTIPVPKNNPIQIVEDLRKSSACKVITVDRSNRNNLLESIINELC